MFKLHGCNILNWIKGGDKGLGQTTSKLIAICANYQCANCQCANFQIADVQIANVQITNVQTV